MPNRAERRAQAKNNRRGVPQQYDQTHGRVRSGMLDEYPVSYTHLTLPTTERV
mgnify:CR=1 FL=1